MSFEVNIETITVEAGADLSAKQYYPVSVASGSCDVVSVLGAVVLGILQDKPAASGRAASVGIGGVSKVVAGAAITLGTELTTDATGRAITTSAADQYIIGTAMEAATAAGDIIAVKLKSYQRSA